MGRMYFPGEKIRQRLPKRESDGDIVGRFGAWLTKHGAIVAYYIAYWIVVSLVLARLFLWVIQTFRSNIFFGILSCYGALAIAWVSMVPSLVIAIIVGAVVWMLGWLCYNKWMLIGVFFLISLWYLMLDGKLMTEQGMSWLKEALLVAWQWYKDVL